MFTNKKSILFITKSKITVSEVSIDSKSTEKIIGQFDWTSSTLDSVFLKIKRIIGDNIRILLGEDFVYVVHITLPSSTSVNRDIVRQEAQDLIPEELNVTVWDFKEIKTASSLIIPTITIQVVAVVKFLFEQLSNGLIKAGFHVEAIEPLSYALARFTKNQEKPFLLVFIADEILLTLAQKEIVLATERLDAINITDINQFIAFAKEKFSLEIKNIVFCGNSKNIDAKQFSNENIKAEIQNISPAISLAFKQDLKGKDEDALNLGLFPNIPAKSSGQKYNLSNIAIIAIGFFVILGIIGGLLIFKK